MVVPDGRFPTHNAYPDCFGFRGGPRGVEGMLAVLVFNVSPRVAIGKVNKMGAQHELLTYLARSLL